MRGDNMVQSNGTLNTDYAETFWLGFQPESQDCLQNFIQNFGIRLQPMERAFETQLTWV